MKKRSEYWIEKGCSYWRHKIKPVIFDGLWYGKNHSSGWLVHDPSILSQLHTPLLPGEFLHVKKIRGQWVPVSITTPSGKVYGFDWVLR